MDRTILNTHLAAFAKGASTFPEYKRQFHAGLPDVGSAHLAESIAAGLGLNTYAALRSRLAADPSVVSKLTLSANEMVERLESLGYDVDNMAVNAAGTQLRAMERAGVEPMLLVQDFERWCFNYGVQLKEVNQDEWLASHVVAGAMGPFSSKAKAAEEAFLAWNK